MRSWKYFGPIALAVLGLACGPVQQPAAPDALSQDTPKYGGILRARPASPTTGM